MNDMTAVRLLEIRNTYKWGGGPDKTILLSAARHDRARVVPVVAYIRDVRDREFAIGDKARALGLDYHEVPERGKFDPRVLWELRKLILKHDINLVHPHDYKSDLFSYLVCCSLGRRRPALLSTAHNWAMVGWRGELYKWIDIAAMRQFDHLIAVSEATRDAMVVAGLPSQGITVIHNGIDTEAWFPRPTSPFRAELKLNHAFPVIGYVGRLTPEKDLETWLRVAARVTARFHDARFVLVGDGADGGIHRELRALAEALGIQDRVLFPGYRQDLPDVYAGFDLFLMTSRREGLSNSILEAMAMGLPLVTTDVGGTKELVVDGESGLLLQAGDVEGLTGAVFRLLDDSELRTRLAQGARRRVENNFSFMRRLQRMEDLYEALLAQRLQERKLQRAAKQVA